MQKRVHADYLLPDQGRNPGAETQKQLKGDGNKVIPPGFLNKEQRRIFRSIVKELEPSGILGNLDVYILTQCAVAIDRLTNHGADD